MDYNRPLCHLFQTYKGHYLYDTNKNQILKISPQNYEFISKCLDTSDFYATATSISDEVFQSFYKNAKQNGYFKRNRVECIEHPATEMLSQMLQKGLNGVALQVTQMCNLRCEYCPYSGHLYQNRVHSNKRMSWETAKKSIDFYVTHSADSNIMALAFYGGEPLLEFDLIKKCILYFEKKLMDKTARFDITTNATLLTDEIVDFFAKHKVHMLISLDGPQSVHDNHRKFLDGKGSFSKVMENVKKYKYNYPEYFNDYVMFNAVINQDTSASCVTDFFDIDSALTQAIVNASMVKGTELKDGVSLETTSEFESSIEFEKFKVILNRFGLYQGVNINRPSIFTDIYYSVRHTSKLLQPFQSLPKKFHPGGPCIPGIKKFFVTVSGKFYPCERVNEESEDLNIGDLKTGINVDKIRNIINIGKLTENNCKECWAFLMCTQCCSHCTKDGKLCASERLKYCRDVRIQVEDILQQYCMYKEFGYDFDMEKSLHFCKE